MHTVWESRLVADLDGLPFLLRTSDGLTSVPRFRMGLFRDGQKERLQGVY
jgi:hypothetical protein